MTTIDFITQSFCCVDDKLRESGPNHKHSQAKLYPSEVITKYFPVDPLLRGVIDGCGIDFAQALGFSCELGLRYG